MRTACLVLVLALAFGQAGCRCPAPSHETPPPPLGLDVMTAFHNRLDGFCSERFLEARYDGALARSGRVRFHVQDHAPMYRWSIVNPRSDAGYPVSLFTLEIARADAPGRDGGVVVHVNGQPINVAVAAGSYPFKNPDEPIPDLQRQSIRQFLAAFAAEPTTKPARPGGAGG